MDQIFNSKNKEKEPLVVRIKTSQHFKIFLFTQWNINYYFSYLRPFVM